MARPSDITLQSTGIFQYDRQAFVNPKLAGTSGVIYDRTAWMANGSHRRRNLQLAVLTTPSGFDLIDGGDVMRAGIKQLFETRLQSLEGLQDVLTVADAENPFGRGGEMLGEPTDVTRERSNVTTGFIDLMGRPYQRIIYNWVRLLIRDPNLGYAGIVAQLDNASKPSDWLPDRYTMSLLAYETDPLMQYVVQAWVLTNMYPKVTPEVLGSFSITEGDQITPYSLQWQHITDVGQGAYDLAQQHLESLTLVGADPMRTPSFVDEIDADVAAADGAAEILQSMADSALSAP